MEHLPPSSHITDYQSRQGLLFNFIGLSLKGDNCSLIISMDGSWGEGGGGGGGGGS